MTLLNIPAETNNEFMAGIIWALSGVIIIMVAIIGFAGKALYNGVMARFDRVDQKLEPMLIEMAVHTEQIKGISAELKEQDRWLRNHDGRIQTLEHKIVHG